MRSRRRDFSACSEIERDLVVFPRVPLPWSPFEKQGQPLLFVRFIFKAFKWF